MKKRDKALALGVTTVTLVLRPFAKAATYVADEYRIQKWELEPYGEACTDCFVVRERITARTGHSSDARCVFHHNVDRARQRRYDKKYN